MADWPDMWSQRALVSLRIKGTGTSELKFQSIIETIDIDEGDADVTEVSTVAGGRLMKEEPQGLTTVTFEGYPVGISTDATKDDLGWSQLFHGGTWATGGGSMSSSPTIFRDKYRVTILWTTLAGATAAEQTIALSTTAPPKSYRYSGKNGYITSLKKSFTDKGLKFTCTIKVPQFNKAGTANIVEEDSDGSAALVVMSTQWTS